MLQNQLFASIAGLVARSKVDEVGPGDPNAEVPVDEFGGNPQPARPPKAIRDPEKLAPDPELTLLDREDGTIEYSTTTGSGVVS